MNLGSLSEEAMQAIVETYGSFCVDCYHSLDGWHYGVRGYRNKVDRLLDNGIDICVMDDLDTAWTLVYKLRSRGNRRQLNRNLRQTGIGCPVPGKGGDVDG